MKDPLCYLREKIQVLVLSRQFNLFQVVSASSFQLLRLHE